ncbi:hypothetical protein TorRG33x02_097610 [Trema orientale]|uniref:Uncharacterized protein n=1 Tax=Trema orientale TaxID=63057 RepID=A0A2P5F9R3_TREOI|nr:hypothetical protein TorRG33x02_097610 [Trema orientale]
MEEIENLMNNRLRIHDEEDDEVVSQGTPTVNGPFDEESHPKNVSQDEGYQERFAYNAARHAKAFSVTKQSTQEGALLGIHDACGSVIAATDMQLVRNDELIKNCYIVIALMVVIVTTQNPRPRLFGKFKYK